MGKLFKGILLAGVAASLVCPGSVFAAVNTKASLKEQIAAEKKEQEKLAAKSNKLNQEINGLKDQLISISGQVRTAENKLSRTEDTLEKLQKQKATYLDQLYKDQDTLGGVVAAASRLNRTSMPYMLVEENPLDIAHTHMVMKSVIPALDARTEEAKAQITEIARLENNISKTIEVKSDELSDLNEKNNKLKFLLNQRGQIYKQTENDRKQQEEKLASLAKEARNLEDLVEKIQLNSKHASNGKIPDNVLLPVDGNIRIGFGDTDDLGAKSKGLTFKTRAGATVVTPLAGTVKFAGPFQKYKQILIIEHSGGYHSLVAGLGHIDTVVGASLAAGEPVGTTDETAQSSGAQVYYELRHDGEPVNPYRLSVAQRQQDKES